VFFHPATLSARPARLSKFYSDSALWAINYRVLPTPSTSGQKSRLVARFALCPHLQQAEYPL
jgi:hypothetical protein